MKPPNFVEQIYKKRRDNGGMFMSEIGVQKVISGFRYRAYVDNDWGGEGTQCFRDTVDEAMNEIDRLWKGMFG